MPPLRFLIISTTLLVVCHAYIGWRLLTDLAWPEAIRHLAWGVLLLSALLQPVALLTRKLPHSDWRDGLSWLSVLCMGFFSCLLVLTLLRDVCLLGLAGVHALSPITIDMAQIARITADGVLTLTLILCAIGFFNARKLARVVHVAIPVRDLPAALHGFRIVQISDVHVGTTIKQGYVSKIVAQVNALEADLVAITGDLVDGHVHELGAHTQPLADLRARHGSFFVTGNHEYYSGALAWIEALQGLGMQVLLNTHVQIQHRGATLVLAGVTDYTAGYFYDHHRSDAHAAIAGAPASAPKILLAHQPRSAIAAASAGFDVQLSGHTHGGQFWPWQYFVPLQQPYVAGLHRLQDLWIYVSRGTGYWGPPLRFGAPSEITCIQLISDAS